MQRWVKVTTRGRGAAGLVLTGFLVAACGAGGYGAAQTSPSTHPAPTPTGAAGGRYGGAPPNSSAGGVAIRSTALGKILTDGAGRSLYLFEKDTGTASTCYGACAQFWPPAPAAGPAQAVGGAQARLVGSTARTDGSRQLTYAGHPLYYFSGDQQPGSVKGEGLKNFGAGWYVLTAQGQKIDND